jgi:inosine-uridine nucleoside N-ribohydrolase/transcriptional regulator GlxA family with amidase domain/catechol 2,3-dioxygenase-like lactoylglutathione lyase family enzyme
MQKLGYAKNVIIDTDMGWDDVIAILLLMKNPNVHICGITVTGCGETHLDDGVALAQGLLALANIKAPVCKGAAVPTMYNHQFPESFRKMMDNACGLRETLPDPLQPVDTRLAWDFMRDTLEREEYQISILSLGGLTNIAKMMEMKPEPQLSNIRRIYIMGGAIYVDGNIAALNNSMPEWDQGPEYASNYYAEWNIYLDPPAASKVLDSEIPTTLVPLDACDYVLLGPEYADMVVADDPVATFLHDLLHSKSEGECKEPIPLPVFDPLAAMIMTGDLRPGHSERLGIDVVIDETEVDNTCGRTEANRREKGLVDTVLQVSERDFKRAFAEHANAPIYSPAPSDETRNVGIFLFEGIEVQDFCGAFEVFAAARHDDGTPAFNVFSMAEAMDSVQAFAGPPPTNGKPQSFMELKPDYTLDDTPEMEVLVIVGGQGIDELAKDMRPDSPLSTWFKERGRAAVYVVTICSGAILAAKAGLLKDIQATTHHTRFQQLKEISNELNLGLSVMDTRNGRNFVQDATSNVICSGGVHCGLAAAVHVVGLFLGTKTKDELAWEIMEYNIPAGCSYAPEGFQQRRNIKPEEFILGISHLNIIMADLEMMDEATMFYRKVLGFRPAWSLWLPDQAAKRFARDAGIGDDCRVMVRFLVHPNAKIHVELMLYEFPKGDQEIHFRKTNDVGGIRHVALEVTDAVAAYHWLSRQEGVTLLADGPPALLAPDPQTFFYFLDPYGVQWEFEQGRPMRRVVSGIVG